MTHKFKLTLTVEVSDFIFDEEGGTIPGPEPSLAEIKDNLQYNVLEAGSHGLSEAMEREVQLRVVDVEKIQCHHGGVFRGETCPKCKVYVT